MKVNIKKFEIEMEVKNNGMELEVRTPGGKRLGDLIVTKTGLKWNKGQSSDGIMIKWPEFISDMEKKKKEEKEKERKKKARKKKKK